MPTAQNNPCGVIQVMTVEEALASGAREEAESEIPSTGVWNTVEEAICRNGSFVIEAHGEGFGACLKFSLNEPQNGSYEIRGRLHKPPENGNVVKVLNLFDEEDWVLTGKENSLTQEYEHCFKVITVSEHRPHTKRIWLVGLKDLPLMSQQAGQTPKRLENN